MTRESIARTAITTLVVILAAIATLTLWRHYMLSPWTRDGRIHAEVVQVAPDVSGLVTAVSTRDNAPVHAGDTLFSIDRSRFRNALDQAQADLAAAQTGVTVATATVVAAEANIKAAQANHDELAAQAQRRVALGREVSVEERTNAQAAARSALAQLQASQADAVEARASRAAAQAKVRSAQVALALAQLNLDRTRVRASVSGHVTNLRLYRGEYAHAGTPSLAIVSHHMWVYGYFEETKLRHVHAGDAADIRLMDGTRLTGTVEGVARGIDDASNAPGGDLLANVTPIFSWVRLAQRIPVRVAIAPASIPDDALIAVGMTATVTLHPRSRQRR